MFYSHQLIARKAHLGQIWMTATLHAKNNGKRLNKLNSTQICEEILNPSVPTGLRLSEILMGGVVTLYEGKLKLLYDDVWPLLVEMNEAWKLGIVAADSTILPIGKTQAKRDIYVLQQGSSFTVYHQITGKGTAGAVNVVESDPIKLPQYHHHMGKDVTIAIMDSGKF